MKLGNTFIAAALGLASLASSASSQDDIQAEAKAAIQADVKTRLDATHIMSKQATLCAAAKIAEFQSKTEQIIAEVVPEVAKERRWSEETTAQNVTLLNSALEIQAFVIMDACQRHIDPQDLMFQK